MMKDRERLALFFTLFLVLMLFACSPVGNRVEDDQTVSATRSDPEQPVSSDDPTPEPSVLEPPSDDLIIDESAYVEGISINIMESFPLQISVTIQGNLPDGCVTIRETPVERQNESTFLIAVITQRPKDAMCTEALVPFEEYVALDVYGLPAGTYTVKVYEHQAEFTFQQDNIIPGVGGCPQTEAGTQVFNEMNDMIGIGYCFLYPDSFEPVSPSIPQKITIIGPNYGEGPAPRQAVVTIENEPAEGKDLETFVLGHMDTLGMGEADLERGDITLGAMTDAIEVHGYKAQVSMRLVYVLFNGHFFTLTFAPADEELAEAYADMERLYTLMISTWVFTEM
jgi:inhibitor of cysteine peptidase